MVKVAALIQVFSSVRVVNTVIRKEMSAGAKNELENMGEGWVGQAALLYRTTMI